MIAGEEEELELHEQQTSRFFPSTGAFAIPLPVTVLPHFMQLSIDWILAFMVLYYPIIVLSH